MNLTKKQKRFYDYLFSYHEENGVLPTHIRIQTHFGYKSPNSVTQHIDALVNKGWLRRDQGLHFTVLTNEIPKGDLSLQECLEVLRNSPSPEVCRLVAQRIDYLTRWHPLNEPIPKGQLYQTHSDEKGEFWKLYGKFP